MKRRLLITILFLALIFSSVGCSKIIRVSPLDIQTTAPTTENQKKEDRIKHGNIIGVELAEGIIGVALSYTDFIQFDSLGGIFDSQTKVISGYDTNGRQVAVHLDHVMKVLRNSDDAVIEFNINGAVFDPHTRLIKGLTTTGERIEIPLDDVLFLNMQKYDALMTLAAVVVPLTALILFIRANALGFGVGGGSF